MEAFERDGVRGFLHRPAKATGEGLALTHGAGSDCRASLLVKVAEAFAESGIVVLRYDLPYRVTRPKGSPFPAGAAADREGIARAVALVRSMAAGRVYAGGHSYGGRQTTMLASEQPALADGLLLTSYPLHPPGKPQQLRTAHFPELRIPALFVSGSRDPFGSPEELEAALAAIPARKELLVVEKSGHELKGAPERISEILTRLRALV